MGRLTRHIQANLSRGSIRPRVGKKVPYSSHPSTSGVPTISVGNVFDVQIQDWYGPHTPAALPFEVMERMGLDETIGKAMRGRKAVLGSADLEVGVPRSDEQSIFLQDRLDENKQQLISKGMWNALDFGHTGCESVWANRSARPVSSTPKQPIRMDPSMSSASNRSNHEQARR